jgi:hypothetical protein
MVQFSFGSAMSVGGTPDALTRGWHRDITDAQGIG